MTLIHFFQHVFSFSRGRFILSVSLAVILGLVQGIGFLSLIPVLETLDVIDGSEGYGQLFLLDSLGQVELSLVSVLVLFVVINGVFYLLRFLKEHLDVVFSEDYLYVNRRRFLSDFLHNWKDGRKSEVANVFINEIEYVAMGVYHFGRMISGAGIVLIYLVMYLLVSWKLTILVSMLVLPYVFAQRFFNHQSFLVNEKLVSKNEEHFVNVESVVKGGEELIGNRKRKVFEHLYDRLLSNIRGLGIKTADLSNLSTLVLQLGGVVLVSVFVYVSLVYVKVNTAQVVVLLVISARLLPMVLSVLKEHQYLVSVLPSFKKVLDVMKPFELNEGGGRKVFFDESSSIISLNKLSYSSVNKVVIDRFDFEIESGEFVLVSGDSGVGKSTLLKLLVGVYHPTSGKVVLDRSLKKDGKVSYVAQDAVLFHATIRENLAWFDRLVSDEDIVEVLKLMKAEFILDHPEGLDRMVVANGVEYSGGEKQRIVLARAILAGSELIVIDEGTNALDDDLEKEVVKALKSLGRTVVMVSHNFSIQTVADRVITL